MSDKHNASDDPVVTLPAQAGKVLRKSEANESSSNILDQPEQKKYREIVVRILHMSAWTRPDIANAVREVSRFGKDPNKKHMKATKQIVNYLWQTPDRGWFLKPNRKRNGLNKMFKFKLRGKSDSNYATCTDTLKSVTSYVVYLEEAPVAIKSVMQKIIALSVTEAELIALVQCVQEMFYCRKVLESLGLTVELQILIQCDNKGAVDLVNRHSIGGNTKHIDVRILHVRDHKDKGVKVEWIPTDSNEADMGTKHSGQSGFDKHSQRFVERDEYHSHPQSNGG